MKSNTVISAEKMGIVGMVASEESAIRNGSPVKESMKQLSLKLLALMHIQVLLPAKPLNNTKGSLNTLQRKKVTVTSIL